MPFPIFESIGGNILFGNEGELAFSKWCCCTCCCARGGTVPIIQPYFVTAQEQYGKSFTTDPCCLANTRIENYVYTYYIGGTLHETWYQNSPFPKVENDRLSPCCCYRITSYDVYDKDGVYNRTVGGAGQLEGRFCYTTIGWLDSNEAGHDASYAGTTVYNGLSYIGFGICLGGVSGRYYYNANDYADVTFNVVRTGTLVI